MSGKATASASQLTGRANPIVRRAPPNRTPLRWARESQGPPRRRPRRASLPPHKPCIVEKVKPHLGDPNFEPEVVAKSSKAAMGLCKWVRAMMLYYDVSKVVGPKRIALAHAEEGVRSRRGHAVSRTVLLQTQRCCGNPKTRRMYLFKLQCRGIMIYT